MISVLRDGNFIQLLCGITPGMTVIVSVLSYGAWHLAGFAGIQNDDLCLSIVFAVIIGVVIFLAGTMKWNLFTKREWVLIPKERLYYVNLVRRGKQ